jgi:pilus assembly protein Flp/PilA
MRNFLNRLMTEEEGATMVEYALMVALIAAAAIVAVTTLGTSIKDQFTGVAGKVDEAAP